jgi:cell wall-associated NlpC family hydrolase
MIALLLCVVFLSVARADTVDVSSPATTRPFDLDAHVRAFEIDPRFTLAHLWMPRSAANEMDVAGFVEHPQFIESLKTQAERRGLTPPTRVKLVPEQSKSTERFAVVSVDRIILRENPGDAPGDRDHVTELLRDEPIWILDMHANGQTLVHAFDGYLGWVHRDQLSFVDAHTFSARVNQTRDDDRAKVAVAAARTFLKTPYVWAGKSKAGIDCSGLVQVAFESAGVLLPRDADQQANVGRLVATRWHRDALLPGDLLFFLSPVRGNVHHVGIYLGNDEFIEAAEPMVKITSLRQGASNYDAKRAETFAWARRVVGR